MPKVGTTMFESQLSSALTAEMNNVISPIVHIGKFKSECELLLNEADMDPSKKTDFTSAELSKQMNVDEDVIAELEQVCSPMSLHCPREQEILSWEDGLSIPENAGLVTLQSWRKICLQRDAVKKAILKCKYIELDCALRSKADTIKAKSPDDQVQYPDVVVTISVSFPRDRRRFKKSNVDYFVLGSQKLSELRDKIPCALDHQPVGEFTENPNHPRDITLKDTCPSSFFYIEKTFYNDMRPNCMDLSKNIIEWAQNNDTPVAPDAISASMQDHTFNDLCIRLGFPYVFLHQGDCEHMLVFKDIRLLNSSDCQSKSSFPITISRAKFKTQSCRVCNLYVSTWSTSQDTLADEDPCFFCDDCFRKLHYDKHGKKLGEFIAHPYINLEGLDY